MNNTILGLKNFLRYKNPALLEEFENIVKEDDKLRRIANKIEKDIINLINKELTPEKPLTEGEKKHCKKLAKKVESQLQAKEKERRLYFSSDHKRILYLDDYGMNHIIIAVLMQKKHKNTGDGQIYSGHQDCDLCNATGLYVEVVNRLTVSNKCEDITIRSTVCSCCLKCE